MGPPLRNFHLGGRLIGWSAVLPSRLPARGFPLRLRTGSGHRTTCQRGGGEPCALLRPPLHS
jgi:hypothetical protein